jgi:hypothetical protein
MEWTERLCKLNERLSVAKGHRGTFLVETLDVRKGERFGSLSETQGKIDFPLFPNPSPYRRVFHLLQVILLSFSLYANETGKVVREVRSCFSHVFVLV